jgi:hypothetical protein
VDHPLLVLPVHLGEGGHVGQEDIDLDDLVDGRAGLDEDGLEVLEAESRFLGDGALDQVTSRVQVDLPRAVDGSGRLDGVGLLAM